MRLGLYQNGYAPCRNRRGLTRRLFLMWNSHCPRSLFPNSVSGAAETEHRRNSRLMIVSATPHAGRRDGLAVSRDYIVTRFDCLDDERPVRLSTAAARLQIILVRRNGFDPENAFRPRDRVPARHDFPPEVLSCLDTTQSGGHECSATSQPWRRLAIRFEAAIRSIPAFTTPMYAWC